MSDTDRTPTRVVTLETGRTTASIPAADER